MLALLCLVVFPSLATAQFVGGAIGDDFAISAEAPDPEEPGGGIRYWIAEMPLLDLSTLPRDP